MRLLVHRVSTCFDRANGGIGRKGLNLRWASTDPRTKPNYVRDKPHVNVCSLGTTGHGKTVLASSISLVQSKKNLATFKDIGSFDKSPEEVNKGCSIQSTKFEFATQSRHYAYADVPGSIEYIKNTITGTYGADFGILVVSGEEGPTLETRQHLTIAQFNGIKQLICFINKVDTVDSDSLELSELATREMLTEEGFDGDSVSFIHGSALNVLNGKDEAGVDPVERLLETLDQLPLPERDLDSPGLFYVDRVYSPPGRTSGVTGVVSRGKFTKGQSIDILGMDRHLQTKISYIETFGKVMEEAIHGDSIEILLQGVKKEDVCRGMTVGPTGLLRRENRLEVELKLLNHHPSNRPDPLITTSFGNFHYETGDVMGLIVIKDKDYLLPGECGLIELTFGRDCVLLEGQSLLIRDGHKIIAVGKVHKILPKISSEEQQKIHKGRSKKEKEQYLALQERIKNDLEKKYEQK